ncbi:MAG: outer membrane beta-barrel protein [Pseudomonadota bacterium]
MNSKPILLAALGALAINAAPALAEGPDYDYLEFRYAETELDAGSFDVEGDGFVANGSFEFAETVHLFVGYDTLEFDDNVELDTLILGAGLAVPLSNRTDLVFRGGFVDASFETPFFEDDDDGYFMSAGVRSMVTPDIELYGDWRRIDLDNSGDENATTIGGDFFVTDTLAVGPSITWIDDTTTWTLGAKLYF